VIAFPAPFHALTASCQLVKQDWSFPNEIRQSSSLASTPWGKTPSGVTKKSRWGDPSWHPDWVFIHSSVKQLKASQLQEDRLIVHENRKSSNPTAMPPLSLHPSWSLPTSRSNSRLVWEVANSPRHQQRKPLRSTLGWS